MVHIATPLSHYCTLSAQINCNLHSCMQQALLSYLGLLLMVYVDHDATLLHLSFPTRASLCEMDLHMACGFTTLGAVVELLRTVLGMSCKQRKQP